MFFLNDSFESVGFLNKELLLFKERISEVLKLFFSNFFSIFIFIFVIVLMMDGIGIFGNINLMEVFNCFLFLYIIVLVLVVLFMLGKFLRLEMWMY